jgi:hypothetical protein
VWSIGSLGLTVRSTQWCGHNTHKNNYTRDEKEVPRVKANPKEKAKESQVKARVIAKAKGQKERTRVA